MAKKKLQPDERIAHFNKLATTPPRISVLSDQPIQNEQSYRESFNLEYRLGPIFDILRHPQTQTPMAIAVYGDWGSGKTTAMKWLDSLIKKWNKEGKDDKKQKFDLSSIWFYPWKYHTKEDVWRGLVSEVIIHSIKVKDPSMAKVKKAIKQFGIFLGRGFVHVLAGLELEAKDPVTGSGAKLSLAGVKEILDEYQEAAHPEKGYLNDFENTLSKWVDETIGKNERLVIFIDDLDRCMPEVALQVLEALKLYLNIDKLIFVVGVDRNVVDTLVARHYRKLGLDPKKSGKYLAKMFQVEVDLAPSVRQIDDFLTEQLKDIDYWTEELTETDQDIFRNLILEMADRNPREVKRLLNSAMIDGAGAMMTEDKISFKQGLQLYFVRKILTDKYSYGSLVGRPLGDQFFGQWSAIVCKHEDDEKFERFLNVPTNLKKTTGMESGRRLDLMVLEKADKRSRLRGDETEADLSFAHEDYHAMLRNPAFSSLLMLLENRQLSELMRIEYPQDTETIAAATETALPEGLIFEAIARQLDIKPEEINKDNLGDIQELNLEGLEITDLEPIRGMTNLQMLWLYDTKVTELEPIRDLTNLQKLSLQKTHVTDLEPIRGLTNLMLIYLDSTQVVELEQLRGLTMLQELSLDYTHVTNLEPIGELISLKKIWLSDTKISVFKPLKGLVNLQLLFLNNSKVTDLEPIRGLTNLQKLSLYNTQVIHLESIKDLKNLQELYLGGTQVTDLEPLNGLTKLELLNLDNTQVADIEPIKGLTNLKSLFLDNTKVTDLEPLKGLTKLHRLEINNTKITDEQIKALQKALPDLTINR